jgi:hypothetical protein
MGMDDRKYRQRGYMDGDDRDRRPESRERPPGPPRDKLGPKTPRMPPRVTVARCANCGTLLPKEFDPHGRCPRCSFELHSCKQCVHFDPAARWECTQPITARLPRKDARNECGYYTIRTSSERETTSGPPAGAARPDDPRKAFENLFKK